jgi:uncharacterized protein (UPF0333 family)
VSRDRGQASVEFLAAIPALLLAVLVAAQLLVTAYALHLADGAAEAGALALAAGTHAEPAARASLPGWARDRIEVRAAGGRVEVAVRPPAPLPGIASALEVTSTAWARPADG